MKTTTAQAMTAKGYALARGQGERFQIWRNETDGADLAVVFDAVKGRGARVNGSSDAAHVAALMALFGVVEDLLTDPAKMDRAAAASALSAAFAGLSAGRI